MARSGRISLGDRVEAAVRGEVGLALPLENRGGQQTAALRLR